MMPLPTCTCVTPTPSATSDSPSAMMMIALSAFKRRNVGSFNRPRLVTAAVLLALIGLATRVSALLSLGCVAAASCALIAYEMVRYAQARDRIRHG